MRVELKPTTEIKYWCSLLGILQLIWSIRLLDTGCDMNEEFSSLFSVTCFDIFLNIIPTWKKHHRVMWWWVLSERWCCVAPYSWYWSVIDNRISSFLWLSLEDELPQSHALQWCHPTFRPVRRQLTWEHPKHRSDICLPTLVAGCSVVPSLHVSRREVLKKI